MQRKLALFSIVFLISQMVSAQDGLPKFSAVLKANGKVIISWKNYYPVVTQIGIQRSADSLKNYTTLLSVPDPSVAENGFVDAKIPNPRIFYRLFIVLDSGRYLFTKPLRPIKDTAVQLATTNTTNKTASTIIDEPDNAIAARAEKQRLSDTKRITEPVEIDAPGKINTSPKIALNKIYYIKKQDSLIGQLFERSVPKFKDSILAKTKDTLVFNGTDTILIRPFIPKEVYKISRYVYTTKDNNVNIVLPEAGQKNCTVKFFEMDGSPLFEIKEIKQPLLTVDKTNFVHAGWFRFELFEDGRLKEKNRLFIQKDF
ncbi:MAG: hypothetical protein JST58_15950 [Bacteroidetes bacterium]|jgi:hypothetical protein|nr:hypothetical protein [Bacteroidota bacterium]